MNIYSPFHTSPNKTLIIFFDEPPAHVAELFRAFSDTNRLRILYTLANRELNVGALADAIGIIVWAAISAGGYHSLNLFLDTVNGFSVAGDAERPIIFAYAIYYIVIGIFLILSVFVGRRAGCHSICWMAPFMILGRKIGNIIACPSLRLQASAEKCTSCLTCNTNYPMSLDVNGMVQGNNMENSECILCGSCADSCANKAIRFAFYSGK